MKKNKSISLVLIVLASVVCTTSISPLQAADTSPRKTTNPLSPDYWHENITALFGAAAERAGKFEMVEMLVAINEGKMGPGQGWFHPSQSRYNWNWLARQHGKRAADGIARKEFKGPAQLFARLDRDGDGRITPGDLDWSRKSVFLQKKAQADRLFRRMDSDGNGRLTREEWNAAFAKIARGKDHLTMEAMLRLLSPPQRRAPAARKGGGPRKTMLIAGLLKGEIGSPCEGPQLNAMAPDFTLKTQDGKEVYSLYQFRGKKPVVLVFGSFT